LLDYSDILSEIEKRIGTKYKTDPDILNLPGSSLACKIDPFYYLALYPIFIINLAKWCKMKPEIIKDTLIRTGNLLKSNQDEYVLSLSVKWTQEMQPIKINSIFVLADFIDSSLKIYARKREILSVSELKIMEQDKKKVEDFFTEKTSVTDVAYTN